MDTRRPRPLQLVGIVLVSAVALVVALNLLGVSVRPSFWPGAQSDNPFADADAVAWVDPDSQAAQAARSAAGDDAAVLERVAAVPAGVWLTPESTGTDAVRQRVTDVRVAARDADRVPLFVVYGIADRDCTGGESAGGLAPDAYPAWIEEAAAGMQGRGPVAVVIEPDALAALQECADPRTRTDLLAGAVQAFTDAGVTTYVDAGHSDWVPAETMAQRLRDVGVEDARGFAVNVSFYGADQTEQAYADAVAAALGGSHYVLDSGRNGSGPGDTWCNPSGRSLGEVPAPGDGALDARLWIKPPGESDGTCNGGPPAGRFWPERALELARAAGW